MAEIERLIRTEDLKSTFLTMLAEDDQHPLYFYYDAVFDAVMILAVPPETETVVHYLGGNIAILYRADDFEVVGIRVEDFETSFVPEHGDVQSVWIYDEKSNVGFDFQATKLGEILVAVELKKRQAAKEIVRASMTSLGETGKALDKVFA